MAEAKAACRRWFLSTVYFFCCCAGLFGLDCMLVVFQISMIHDDLAVAPQVASSRQKAATLAALRAAGGSQCGTLVVQAARALDADDFSAVNVALAQFNR